MEITTRDYGKVTVAENAIFNFKEGIPGFEDLTRFILISNEEEQPFSYLQSIDDANVCLAVINPFVIMKNYELDIDESMIKSLGEIVEGSLSVLTVLVVPEDVEKMTSNLMAPILLNHNEMSGLQITLKNDSYKVKYPIYDLLVESLQTEEEKPC